ncbi:hypothetical protein HMPREF9166_1355 [Selenomonas sp. oral taxon 149 str. 67H29BP]|nr:hypothetical protein HMPREF9166_1355 [Selenomonas sp. oral taxon 149 str. 67H29BP]
MLIGIPDHIFDEKSRFARGGSFSMELLQEFCHMIEKLTRYT